MQRFRGSAATCVGAALLAVGLGGLGGCDAVDPSLLRRGSRADAAVADGGGGARDAAPPPGDSGPPPPPGDGGFGECDDALSPGRCSRPHAQTTCVESQCLIVECDAPWLDCNGDAKDGCEATLDDVDHCGLCGKSCVLPHAQVACEDRQCVFVACEKGHGDCDDDTSTGCETPLDTLANCGRCGGTCGAVDNGVPGCIDGGCGVGGCVGAFGDCNGLVGDGCEQPLASDAHCGACDTPCAPDNASGSCGSGQCAITSCKGAYEDCNGLAADGCEATLISVAHCGACGRACELPLHATVVTCHPTRVRCEVDHDCPEGASSCVDGAPENGCDAGYADCDGDGGNGCEVKLGTLTDCGGCGDACDEPNAENACNGGSCERSRCQPGYGDCGGGSCVWLGADPARCGDCGTSCSGATAQCAGGACTGQSCAAGTADCDGTGACETTLSGVSDCGQCGLACGPYDDAQATCTGERCAIGSCSAGHLDCDGAVHNGCEVNARTRETCGSCGSVCSIPHAEESCDGGSCELVGCDPGRADCNADLADGCESSTLLPSNCGSCGNDCTGRPHTQAGGCNEGSCELVCEDGYRDCNGDTGDGCEASLDGAEHCGACDNDCTSLPNVRSASCGDSVCVDLVCEPGYADCDKLASNGCERSTRTATDCGACDVPCALPNGNASCGSGSCALTGCKPGYADCNGSAGDGCEASLGDPESCGSCSVQCEPGLGCSNGMCACDDDGDCKNVGEQCCAGVCKFTQSDCFPWPCIPGTVAGNADCGACGQVCPLFCCAVP